MFTLQATFSVGSPSTASLNVIDTDLLPVAFDDAELTDINTALDVSAVDLSFDPTGDGLTVSAVTQGDHGTVTNNLDGTVTYTPDTDYVGDDSFTYTVEDEFGNTSTGTVSVTVTAPEAPPTSVWTATNTAVNVAIADATTDPDGDTLSVTAVTQGTHGSVVIELDGTVTYTPATSYTGDDSFTYTVEDGDGNAATNTVTVTVGTTDPVALDGDAATAVSTAKVVTVTDLAYQPAGGSLTVTGVTQGSHGAVVNNTDGTVTYTPTTGYTGTDTFTYTVTDSNSHTATGTITVTVGTPAATDADDIDDALEDIADDVGNYSTGDESTIASAASAVATSITSYLSTETTFISAHSIDYGASSRPFKDLAEALVPDYEAMVKQCEVLKTLEDSLYSLMCDNADLIWSLGQQRKTAMLAGNAGQIAALNAAIGSLSLTQLQLKTVWEPLLDTRGVTYVQTRDLQKLIIVMSPTLGTKLSSPPAAPAERDVTRITPKLP